MTLQIAERSYELEIKKLKLKALRALESFRATENLSDLLNLLSLILNEPDVAFLEEELTVGHIEEIKAWASALRL